MALTVCYGLCNASKTIVVLHTSFYLGPGHSNKGGDQVHEPQLH